MNDTEELIKAALVKGAGRAPHPGQIINALNSPRRRTRPALLAIVGALVVVAAITIPIAFRSAPPTPPATEYTPPPPPEFLPTRFTITDIPAGYVERRREAFLDGSEQSRGWMNGNNAIHLTVYTPRSSRWAEVSRRRVNATVGIGRVAGWWIVDSDTLAEVAWLPDPDTVIRLQVYGPDARSVAFASAESVRPDPAAGLRTTLSFGQLPSRFDRLAIEVFGSSPANGGAWLAASASGPPATESEAQLRARIVAKGTTKLTGWNVVVPTPDGREIELIYTASAKLTELEALEIAERIRIGPEPDLSWLGK